MCMCVYFCARLSQCACVSVYISVLFVLVKRDKLAGVIDLFRCDGKSTFFIFVCMYYCCCYYLQFYFCCVCCCLLLLLLLMLQCGCLALNLGAFSNTYLQLQSSHSHTHTRISLLLLLRFLIFFCAMLFVDSLLLKARTKRTHQKWYQLRNLVSFVLLLLLVLKALRLSLFRCCCCYFCC